MPTLALRSRFPSLPRRLLVSVISVALLAGGMAAVPASRAVAEQPQCEEVTVDNECGMDLERAWAEFTRGDPELVISYVEGGINWHVDSARTLLPNIRVNRHEVPVACAAEPCARRFSSSRAVHDTDGNGRVNAIDWAEDPRVGDRNGNGYVDPEDLIAAFSDRKDQDGNGYPDDISGWDFYDDQNDPATYDTAYTHANNQMLRLQQKCPLCSILPVKAGAEALDRTDDLAEAWLFSADSGAQVIASVTADLGYSRFMREAVGYLEHKGVLMVEASNDFDSLDHQGGMFWPYVVPGNGAVLAQDGRRWVRSNYTSWGVHNMFTAPTHGGTTSEATPTVAGVFGLLMSWGRQAAARGLIDHPLSGPEAIQVMRATARRVTDPTLAWPGEPGGWNLQYGYGIPQLYRAMKWVAAGRIPPVARIESPEWYSLFDPTRSRRVPVRGRIRSRSVTGAFRWKLQAGPGPDPSASEFVTIGSGTGVGSYSGLLGWLSPSSFPRSFWAKTFQLSSTKSLETAEQYTVSLRLLVSDADGYLGGDRRAVNVFRDGSWMDGFPLRIGSPSSPAVTGLTGTYGSGGEAQPALVDLQGAGRLAIVFGDTSGFVHAVDPQTRRELPGWPAKTRPTEVTAAHSGVRPGFEPLLQNVAVGDLDGNGKLSVVATSTTGRTYVFNADGTLREGWPNLLDMHVEPPPIPRPQLPFTRLPVRGAVAAPVLYDLDGNGALEIVQAGWDGYVHVWRADGSDVSGWPVKVEMPPTYRTTPGYEFVNDQKLDSTPAIAYLQGRARGPFVVVRPQYTETQGEGLQPAPYGFVFAYDANGQLAPGWPVRMPGVVEYYGSAQEFITEGNANPVAADLSGTGAGADSVAVGPVLSPPYLISGSGQIIGTYQAGDEEGDTPVAFTTSGAFGKVGGVFSYAQAETGGTSLAQALLEPNNGKDIREYEVVYPPNGGPARPGFPVRRQGIDFLGQPIIADVTGDGSAEVIDGGDSNAMHAYTGTGSMADGFPKWHTGWNLFSPAVGDLDGDGKVELVVTTREGYVFAWKTDGTSAANVEWWRNQHDEWNTGNYASETRPPGTPQEVTWTSGAATLSFVAPGDVWYHGKPAAYRVTFAPSETTVEVPATVAAGEREVIAVPAATTAVTIQAVGSGGLLGVPVTAGAR